jgi:prepilin-type N-terminal cleavage/methylation domain-containing protein
MKNLISRISYKIHGASRALIYNTSRAFTLIETLVAISLLSVAIVAPMSLTSQSLSTALYARDQITAFNLAQEGLEAVRSFRDGQILQISQTTDPAGIDLFGSIPINQDFTVDSRITNPAQAMSACAGTCAPLQTNGTLYGYDPDTSSWPITNFTRVLHANYVGAGQDEIRISVTVSWPTVSTQIRSFVIYENLYRWVNDGSAAI